MNSVSSKMDGYGLSVVPSAESNAADEPAERGAKSRTSCRPSLLPVVMFTPSLEARPLSTRSSCQLRWLFPSPSVYHLRRPCSCLSLLNLQHLLPQPVHPRFLAVPSQAVACL